MKRFLLLLTTILAAVLCTFSCTQEIEGTGRDGREKVRPEMTNQHLVLTASIEDNVPDTKTQLDADGKFLWSPGDKINLIFGSGTGSEFTAINNEPAATTQFEGDLDAITGFDEDAPDIKFWGIYPYNADNEVFEYNDEYCMVFDFPSVQYTGENTWGQKQFAYIGQSKGLAMGFRNVCSGFKFYLENDNIKEIRIKGNNNEFLAGTCLAAMRDKIPTLVAKAANFDKEIILYPPMDATGAAGTFKKSVDGNVVWYYLAVPPTTFSKGVTFTFYTTDWKVGTRTFSSSISATRNNFVSWVWPNKALDRSDKVTFTDVQPESNQIIYYAESKLVGGSSNYASTFLNHMATQHEFSNGRGVLTFAEPLTELPEGAFEMTWVESVVLPEGLKTIGVEAFVSCTSLKSVQIPDSVTYINDYAFRGCTALESIHIPASVEMLGANPFLNCTNLKSFSGPTALNNGKFMGTVDGKDIISCALGAFTNSMLNIPEGVEKIGNEAFYGGDFSYVYIPASIQKIGKKAFAGCTASWMRFRGDDLPQLGTNALSDTDFPLVITGYSTKKSSTALSTSGNLWNTYRNAGRIAVFQDSDEIWYHTSDGNSITLASDLNFGTTSVPVVPSEAAYAFSPSGYTLSPTVSIPSDIVIDNNTVIWIQLFSGSLINVPDRVFYNNQKLDYLTLPPVNAIGNSAFEFCLNLLKFPNNGVNLMTIGNNAFAFCTSMKASAYLPDVTRLGDCAFQDCYFLESINLPSATILGDRVFYNCGELKSINIPLVESVGEDCFYQCQSLPSLVLPKVKTIGDNAFAYTHKLTSLKLGSGLTTMGINLFLDENTTPTNSGNLEIYFYGNPIPTGSNWRTSFCYKAGSYYQFKKIHVPSAYLSTVQNTYQTTFGPVAGDVTGSL